VSNAAAQASTAHAAQLTAKKREDLVKKAQASDILKKGGSAGGYSQVMEHTLSQTGKKKAEWERKNETLREMANVTQHEIVNVTLPHEVDEKKSEDVAKEVAKTSVSSAPVAEEEPTVVADVKKLPDPDSKSENADTVNSNDGAGKTHPQTVLVHETRTPDTSVAVSAGEATPVSESENTDPVNSKGGAGKIHPQTVLAEETPSSEAMPDTTVAVSNGEAAPDSKSDNIDPWNSNEGTGKTHPQTVLSDETPSSEGMQDATVVVSAGGAAPVPVEQKEPAPADDEPVPSAVDDMPQPAEMHQSSFITQQIETHDSDSDDDDEEYKKFKKFLKS